MGMYTELVMAAEIMNKGKVIHTLKYMLGETEYAPVWDDEKFFQTDKWEYMLRCDSYYFDGQTDSKLYEDNMGRDTNYYLNVRCNLKNYSQEIQHFLEWLNPYILTEGFLGYYRYEECDDPTLIYREDGKIICRCIRTNEKDN